jgi:hypothetical protein
MSIRQEFRPRNPDKAIVRELSTLATEIVRHLDGRQDYDPLVDRFNQIAGTQLTIADFDAMAGSMEAGEFVREIMSPHPKVHADVTDAEYVQIIRTIREAEVPDRELGYWETFLEINLRSRSVHELLYERDDLPDEEVLAEARKNRPIAL